MKTTDLSKYNNSWYRPGSKFKRAVWYLMNLLFVRNRYCPIGGVKKLVLRMFGARIGRGVVIKPGVNIKYPWKLEIGDYTWIGEDVWIDNLGLVRIGSNCCLSQGALLLCGNHNYKKTTFDLMVGDILLEDGVWIGAKALVTGGSIAHSHALLTAGSVLIGSMDEYSIYQGNPAKKIREREIKD